MKASEVVLGLQVHAPDTLFREREWHARTGASSSGWRKTWKRAAETMLSRKPVPATGIIVGIRSLHETGISESNGEYVEWSGLSRRTAVLIATDLRKSPALAWIEDITLKGEKTHG